jgi:hypothetical protein
MDNMAKYTVEMNPVERTIIAVLLDQTAADMVSIAADTVDEAEQLRNLADRIRNATLNMTERQCLKLP